MRDPHSQLFPRRTHHARYRGRVHGIDLALGG